MAIILQGEDFNRTFILVSSLDHTLPLLGATPTVLISKNGQPFEAPLGTVTELGGGWYNLALLGSDTNTVGELTYHITAVGADNTYTIDQVLTNINISPSPPPYINQVDIANYILWIRGIMGVPSSELPDGSPYIQTSYLLSTEMVNEYIQIVSPVLYTQAVYNLGGDYLVNLTQDISPSTYWSTLRKTFQINNFVPGVVNATNDEDTSAAIITPLGLQNVTLGDLQNLKTPYGRAYLSIAQSVGSMWGIS